MVVVLAEVVRTLRWVESDGLVDEVYVATIERLAGAFSAALTRLEVIDPGRATSLRLNASACPPDSFLRFLTAPETFARLAAGPLDDQKLLCFAEESILAELCRCGHENTRAKAVWTALGDNRFPGTLDDRVTGALDPLGESSAAGSFRTRCAGGLPVDFISPYASSRDIPMPGPVRTIDAFVCKRVVRDVGAAIKGIRAVSASALSTVRRFTRVIVVRMGPEPSGKFLSSSSPRYLGRTVLCNPDAATLEELAEALVHESIHGLLSSVQLQRPFVRDHATLSERTVTSPWTGNVLPMDAYVEACFIWYSLSRFWGLDLSRSGFRAEEAARLAKRSRSGFLGPRLVQPLVDMRAALSGDVLDAVAFMQETVRAS